VKYALNQTVWVKMHHPSVGLKPYTITKIGRKWAELSTPLHSVSRYRFDVATGELDGHGYSTPGTVYLSEEAYAEELAISTAWSAFQSQVRYVHRAPKGVTPEAISQALKLLGIETKP
jgi:hypothetical protein